VRLQYQLATVIHRKTLSIESIKLCNDPELSSLLEDWHHQKLRPNVISQLTETYIDGMRSVPGVADGGYCAV
jgi:hypothetical protein